MKLVFRNPPRLRGAAGFVEEASRYYAPRTLRLDTTGPYSRYHGVSVAQAYRSHLPHTLWQTPCPNPAQHNPYVGPCGGLSGWRKYALRKMVCDDGGMVLTAVYHLVDREGGMP